MEAVLQQILASSLAIEDAIHGGRLEEMAALLHERGALVEQLHALSPLERSHVLEKVVASEKRITAQLEAGMGEIANEMRQGVVGSKARNAYRGVSY